MKINSDLLNLCKSFLYEYTKFYDKINAFILNCEINLKINTILITASGDAGGILDRLNCAIFLFLRLPFCAFFVPKIIPDRYRSLLR